MLNNAECAVVYVDADIDADNDWLINYMKFQFVSRLHPQLSRRTKLKMASQSAPSSAAMEIASGEEVIPMIKRPACMLHFTSLLLLFR